ncbi:helix-turn-helix transcriptional regulator [Flavivirga amylovorans]|uniref:Helix-turn-helix transcriptional regulator n=1 Tax=Flavivirga amylovorans TaxID=870486 RepID=A0ABT8WYX6_9FLAO|nr:helix-turn-helix transcriptional regulator [Flavivirga amylovorans]MDO5986882.1 helix-turn-helix transcriptional regulator [Flavivirga amylovorans]
MQHNTIQMTSKKQINRIRVVLAEQDRTNKWLSEKVDKNRTTVSRWCTNDMQPSLETLVEIAEALDVDIRELLNPTKDER